MYENVLIGDALADATVLPDDDCFSDEELVTVDAAYKRLGVLRTSNVKKVVAQHLLGLMRS